MLFIQEINGDYRQANEADVLDAATELFNRYFTKGTAIIEPAKAEMV